MNSASGHSASRGFVGSDRSSSASLVSMWSSGLQDRVAAVAEAVADHPLDLADPDGHAGELGGVGVDLDAQDRLGADLRDLHRRCEDERAPVDRLELEVLERPQRDEQEVAGAAGGVEHADAAQSIEEGLEDGLRVLGRAASPS